MGELTGLAYKLNLPIEEVIALMLKLDIPVDSPDYILTTKDVKKIKKYLRKNNNSYLKDTLVAGVAIMSIYFMFSPIGNFIMGINNNEPLTFTTAISLENEYSAESRSSNYYMLSNECTPVDYADTDFLVVENIKVFLSNNEYYTGTINGVFDEELKDSVKDFQKDMGIRIDGVVGPTTHKIMQNYNSCTKKSIENLISCYGGDYKAYLECTSPYESSGILTTTTLDSHPPKWAEDPLTIININSSWMSPNVMRATVLWGHVTDDVGIDEYQIYVDGKLYTTIPGLNCKTKCSSQSSGRNARISDLVKDNYHTIEVRACDGAGNCSTNNPTITKEFKEKEPVVSESVATTTTLPGTPTVTITSSQVSDGDTSADSSITLTFITSASTTNFAVGDVTVSGGTLTNFIGFQTEYAVTFTPSAVGATTIDVAANTFTNTATGISNVAATQFNWTYSPAPTMTITAAEVNDGDTSNDSSLSLTFTASQSTTNFAAGDVTVSGGTLSNFSGSGTTYTATFTPSAEGATTIDVAANSFTNAFSTNNTAATQFNWTYSTTSNSTTSANRWVIAVIDETGGAIACIGSASTSQSYPGPSHNGNCDVNGAWGEFRTLWPNRKFFLIEPMRNNGTQSLTGLDQSIKSASNILMPTAFVTEAQAGVKAVYIQSTRNTTGTNWWSKIGGSSLPSGAEVILWVDNSGSLTTGTVQAEYNAFKAAAAAANVTVTEVTNLTSGQGGSLFKEDWINPFDPDYP